VNLGSNVVDFPSGSTGFSAASSLAKFDESDRWAEYANVGVRLWTVGLGFHLERTSFAGQSVRFPPQAFAGPTPPSCVVDFKKVQEASSAISR